MNRDRRASLLVSALKQGRIEKGQALHRQRTRQGTREDPGRPLAMTWTPLRTYMIRNSAGVFRGLIARGACADRGLRGGPRDGVGQGRGGGARRETFRDR